MKNKKYLFKTSDPKEISLIIVIRLLKLLPKIFNSVGFFKTIFTTFFAILKIYFHFKSFLHHLNDLLKFESEHRKNKLIKSFNHGI